MQAAPDLAMCSARGSGRSARTEQDVQARSDAPLQPPARPRDERSSRCAAHLARAACNAATLLLPAAHGEAEPPAMRLIVHHACWCVQRLTDRQRVAAAADKGFCCSRGLPSRSLRPPDRGMRWGAQPPQNVPRHPLWLLPLLTKVCAQGASPRARPGHQIGARAGVHSPPRSHPGRQSRPSGPQSCHPLQIGPSPPASLSST